MTGILLFTRMGDIHDNAFEGAAAEDDASRFLTRHFSLSRPRPDLGMDFVGLYRGPGPVHPIAFQVKKANRFTFESRVLMKWIGSIDTVPVIFLRVETVSFETTHYWFRVLHDWVLDTPEWAMQLPRQKSKDIGVSEFVRVDADQQNFIAAVESELSRVSRDGVSLWSTRTWRGLPITEPELFSYFGRLGRLEPEAVTLDSVSERFCARSQEQQWSVIRKAGQERSTDPLLSEWYDALHSPVLPSDIEREVTGFREFVSAIRSFSSGGTFHLPRTRWGSLSPWRSFCQMYPRSLDMIERFLTTPAMWKGQEDRLGSALILVATLANSEDSVLAECARGILARAKDYFSGGLAANYGQYGVMATYYATCCEAGFGAVGDRCVDFHRRHDEQWQIQWQRDYYRADDLVSASVALQKLTHPTLRHRKTHDLEEWRLQLLRSNGVQI